MTSIEDNEVYLEKWYEVCTGIIKLMNWDILKLSPDMEDTFLNAWRCAETVLNEEEYNLSTWAIFECITGIKPNTSSPEGCAQFNTFTTTYNAFCVAQNFLAGEGFPESQDEFFKFYLANAPKASAPPTIPPKSIRFESVPPIATLPPAPSSSPEDFPALIAPMKAPISYTSAAGSSTTTGFTTVTCQRKNKPVTPQATPQAANPATTIKPQTAPK